MKRHLTECLVNVKLFHIPDIPLDRLFLRKSILNDCLIEDKLAYAPIVLFKKAFFSTHARFDYTQNEKSKILFYLSDSTRKSSEENFNKAVSTVPISDTLIERRCKGRFRLQGFYILFILVPIWVFQLQRKGLRVIEIYQVLKELTDVFYVQQFLLTINCKKYNLLVTYYDSKLHECLLVLLFKKNGIKTATLQHGQFNAWREDTFVNCGLEFNSSSSDYHLCWNKFARDEGLKSGWKEENLPLVGIISNIDKTAARCIKPNNRTFGVVLSHPSWEHENIEMIKAANILAEHFDLKYVLKLHPNYKENYFQKYVRLDYYIGNVKKGIDMLAYANSVDFSIVGSSSVFVEMVYLYHDILRYSTKLPSDKFSNINTGCIFHSKEQIIECFEKLNEECKELVFDYLCETTNTFESYRNFFSKYI